MFPKGLGLGRFRDCWVKGSRLGGTPHPVIVNIRDNKDYMRVLLYSFYTTITGWGVLLRSTVQV